jgi:hypothetical protein
VLDLKEMQWRAPVLLGVTTGTVIIRWLDARRVLIFAERPDGLRVFGFDSFPAAVASNDRYLYLPDPGTGALVANLASGSVLGRIRVEGLDELLSPTSAAGAGCR